MLKSYIKKIVKTELAKEKLNKQYGKFKVLVPQLNDVIHQQNSEISKLYNTNSSLKQENEELKNRLKGSKNTILELKESYSKEKLEKNKLLFNGYGERYEKDFLLKQISEQYEEIEKLEEVIKNLGGTVSLKDNLLNEKNKEIEQLKKYREIDFKASLQSGFQSEDLKQENEKLKKDLLDFKNGLNGANHVIKNNKEWIKSQDKKIKELEEEIRLFKSDKEDLQYNLRRVSTQKIQLESKNKSLEEKLDGIKYVTKEQRLSALTYEKLKKTFILIERYIKES